MPSISAFLRAGSSSLALAEIGSEGDDLGAELGLQPLEDDRGVETAGIGEHDLLDVFPLRHLSTAPFASGRLGPRFPGFLSRNGQAGKGDHAAAIAA
jgi:hypothetical protein